LVPANWRWSWWSSMAGNVTAGLAESNSSLPQGEWLIVTCGLTAYTPGSALDSMLGNEYGKQYFILKTLCVYMVTGEAFCAFATQQCWLRHYIFRLSICHFRLYIFYERLEQSWWDLLGIIHYPLTRLNSRGQNPEYRHTDRRGSFIYIENAISGFCVSQGSAEALVRCSGKVKYLLIACWQKLPK